MTRTLYAPAKINLTLDVLRRRDDGYHEIASVLLALTLADRLTVERSDHGIEVTAEGFAVPQGEGNIAHRAAALCLQQFGLSGGCRIHIDKRIPVGAGLGGGSSDAAAAINWLADEAGATEGDMRRAIAGRIGSDVPFFIDAGCALARGRGEILAPLPCPPPMPTVVVGPGDPVSTREAYSHIAPSGRAFEDGASAKMADLLRRAVGWRDIAAALSNDFEEAVLPHRPDIADAKRFLIDNGALGAMLAGSGAAVFGMFDDPEHAQTAADLARINFGWAVEVETAKE